MFKITGTKCSETITVECNNKMMFKFEEIKDGEPITAKGYNYLNFTFNGDENECYKEEIEFLMKSPSGGTYCPEEQTELHAYLTLKERFFDEVLKEEIAEIGELENEPQTVY